MLLSYAKNSGLCLGHGRGITNYLAAWYNSGNEG